MRLKSREKFLAAADQAAFKLGVKSIDSVMDQGCIVLAAFLEKAGKMRTREGLIEVLDNVEASPQEERLMIAAMRMMPMLLRFGLRKIAKDATGTLPGPPTGREPVPIQMQAEVINLVAKLHTQGVDLGASKYRASQHFSLGFRTVERIWNNRSEVLDGGPDPRFKDVLDYIKSGKAPGSE